MPGPLLAARPAVAALLTGLLAGLLTVGLVSATTPTAAQATPRTGVGGPALDLPGTQVAPHDDRADPLPRLSASSWVIADADTGEVLAAKDAHERRRPASTLKTLTALAVIPRLDPDQTYVPTYDDIAVEGSKVGIVNGSRYTVEQLWYGLFLASGNDAALALAKANGGVRTTVEQMNAEAARLQANDTVAKTVNGLDAEGQHSSAYDLALFARAGLAMPDFEKYCSTVSVKFPREGRRAKRSTFMVYNHNPLLLGGYRGAIGVKTGYTTLAGRTFVGAAERKGRRLVVTIMNYGGSTYTTAASLLSWGFDNADRVEPVGQLVDPLPAGGTSADAGDASGAGGEGTTASAGSGSDAPPLWPFLLVGLPVLLVALWAMFGGRRGSRDPLAVANKGLGSGRFSGNRPRSRSGPRSDPRRY